MGRSTAALVVVGRGHAESGEASSAGEVGDEWRACRRRRPPILLPPPCWLGVWTNLHPRRQFCHVCACAKDARARRGGRGRAYRGLHGRAMPDRRLCGHRRDQRRGDQVPRHFERTEVDSRYSRSFSLHGPSKMNILGALHESLTRRKYLKSEVLNFGLLLTVARTSTFQFLYGTSISRPTRWYGPLRHTHESALDVTPTCYPTPSTSVSLSLFDRPA